ncbi:MAG: AAA-like domain-containing protein [Cyanobacteriota bacterium]|nr:AAA-like domain-containing protein [Cyanobacteriota bacterium]
MDFEEAFTVADTAVFTQTGEHLSDRERTIIQGAWDSLSYEEIAEKAGYTTNYLQRDVGRKLWKKLSEGLGESVTKSNFRTALERRSQSQTSIELEYPDGPVPLNSPFYIERPPIESLCYETVIKPGSLLRIKAPKFMGKTSLINLILDYAVNQNHQTIYLSLSSLEARVIKDLDKLLYGICYQVGKELNLKNQLDEYWDTGMLSSTSNCIDYFEEYLLAEIDSPVIVAFDDVDRVFPYPEVAEDFFGMLRSWYEKGKNLEIWKKMRLIVAHSTDAYIPLNINKSPFNVGLPIELPQLTSEQIEDLAQRYQLNNMIEISSLSTLKEVIGGHPALLQLAFYHLAQRNVTLEQLLKDAPTETGIYRTHLLNLWDNLRQDLELVKILKTIITSSQAISINRVQSHKLQGMGLVKVKGNQVEPSCTLYRNYFCQF